MERRDFLASTLAATTAAAPASGSVRVACGSFCFHAFRAGAYPDEAVDIIGSMGFDGIELIINAREDFDTYWQGKTLDALRARLDKHKLAISQFILFQPVVEGLTSLDKAERDRNLDWLERGAKVARQLNAPILNIVAPWPREITGPVDYIPRYYDIESPKPNEKFHLDIAPGFDWDKVWAAYIETTKACLQRVKAHGMKLTIEHHTHTMIPGVDAFLRLWDAIRDPALGYNLDIGWTHSHRDYPPLAIYKVKRQLMNLHMRNIDGHMRRFPHIGEGVMDFKHVAQALKTANYRGFVTLEQDKHPGDMKATARRFLAMMREYLA
jgi:sugar phosphate isomerase/epimerase